MQIKIWLCSKFELRFSQCYCRCYTEYTGWSDIVSSFLKKGKHERVQMNYACWWRVSAYILCYDSADIHGSICRFKTDIEQSDTDCDCNITHCVIVWEPEGHICGSFLHSLLGAKTPEFNITQYKRWPVCFHVKLISELFLCVFVLQHVPDSWEPAARAVLCPLAVLQAEDQTLPGNPCEFPSLSVRTSFHQEQGVFMA